MERKFDVHIDESTHLAFTRLVCAHRFKRTAINMTGFLALLLIGGLTIGSKGWPIAASVIGCWVAFLVILSIQWLFLPHYSRKSYRQNRLLSQNQHLLVDQNELQIETELSKTRVPWDLFVKWDENDMVLALYPQTVVAYLIPKSQVPVEICDFVRECVIGSGLPMKGKQRK